MRTLSLPGPEQLQVWQVSLLFQPDEVVRLQRFLSPEELRRGNRLIDEHKRQRFFAGRGILRELLGGYLGEEPGTVGLSEGEFGKLALCGPGRVRISFNVSHAGDLLLLAFAAGREVGIDLEQVRQDLPFRPMAERYFSPREQEELFSLPESEQVGAFYRCWTRKEAYMKGTGTGFSQPSTGFDVSLQPSAPALLAHRVSPGDVGRWSIMDLAMPEGYCAAVAAEGAEPEVVVFR